MNILIVGSAHPALRKTVDWLSQTTWIISRIVVAEERSAKMTYVFERLKEQPHPFLAENVSIVPDGTENKLSEYKLGSAVDINTYIKSKFPDGTIDYLFFCVKNDKADIILDKIDPSVHKIGKYYFLESKGYE
jgi:hypothetical protein